MNRLPWRVWTGSGWEKHEGPVPPFVKPKSGVDADLERGDLDSQIEDQLSHSQSGAQQLQCKPSTSHDEEEEGGDGGDTQSINPPWFDAQTECAICLNDFERGDRVRVLPCKHIFHLDEVDEWLIHRKKLVGAFSPFWVSPGSVSDNNFPSVLYAKQTSRSLRILTYTQSIPTIPIPILLQLKTLLTNHERQHLMNERLF